MTDLMVKIIVEVLDILAAPTKEIKQIVWLLITDRTPGRRSEGRSNLRAY
jgi:hypothetical protein